MHFHELILYSSFAISIGDKADKVFDHGCPIHRFETREAGAGSALCLSMDLDLPGIVGSEAFFVSITQNNQEG